MTSMAPSNTITTDSAIAGTSAVSNNGSTLIAVGEFVSEIFQLINDFAFADLVDGSNDADLGASSYAIEENLSFLGFIGAVEPQRLCEAKTKSKSRKSSHSTTDDVDRSDYRQRTNGEAEPIKKKKKKKDRSVKKDTTKQKAADTTKEPQQRNSERSKRMSLNPKYREVRNAFTYDATAPQDFALEAPREDKFFVKENHQKLDESSAYKEWDVMALDEDTWHGENHDVWYNPFRQSEATSEDGSILLTKKLDAALDGSQNRNGMIKQNLIIKSLTPLVTSTLLQPTFSAMFAAEVGESRDDMMGVIDLSNLYASRKHFDDKSVQDSATNISFVGDGNGVDFNADGNVNVFDSRGSAQNGRSSRRTPSVFRGEFYDGFKYDHHVNSTDDTERQTASAHERVGAGGTAECTNIANNGVDVAISANVNVDHGECNFGESSAEKFAVVQDESCEIHRHDRDVYSTEVTVQPKVHIVDTPERLEGAEMMEFTDTTDAGATVGVDIDIDVDIDFDANSFANADIDESPGKKPRTVEDELYEAVAYNPHVYSFNNTEQQTLKAHERLDGGETTESTNTTSEARAEGWTSETAQVDANIETIQLPERLAKDKLPHNDRSALLAGDDSPRDTLEEENQEMNSNHVSTTCSRSPSIQQFHSLNQIRPATIAKYNKQWPPLQFPEGRFESFNAEMKSRHVQSTVHLAATVPKSSRVRENRQRIARQWTMRMKQQALWKESAWQDFNEQNERYIIRDG
jgi:hypothetical protein